MPELELLLDEDPEEEESSLSESLSDETNDDVSDPLDMIWVGSSVSFGD